MITHFSAASETSWLKKNVRQTPLILDNTFKKLVAKMTSCLLPSLVFQKTLEHIPEQTTHNCRYIFRYDEEFRKLTLDQRVKELPRQFLF